MRNSEVAKLLYEIADLLELKGESVYRVVAYREAARSIENLPRPVEALDEEGKLEEIPKVGKSIAEKIHKFLGSGRLEYYEDLKKQFPAGLIEMQEVPGVGPKLAKLFYEKLKISSIPELEKAAKEHEISKLPRMGEKAEEKILKGIQMLKERSGRLLLGTALPAAEEVVAYLKKVKEVERVSPAGSIRRMKETIGDIDILVASKEQKAVIDAFTKMPLVKEVLSTGETKASILTKDNLQIDLRVVAPDSWGAALQYFTGSKPHNIRLREIAIKLGWKINEYGVFEEKTEKKIAGENEEEIYKLLGLQYIAPELREDTGEVEAAKEARLVDLVSLKEIKGDIHVHSNWSDGSASIEEMAVAAKMRGYEYLAVCDHSQSLGVAGGLSPEEVLERRKEIHTINKKLDFVILDGIEVNIMSNGNLDFEDKILKSFDIVVAGIHTGFAQPKEKITQRIVSAMENEHVDIISHPTGRLIDKRPPYEVDVDRIIKVAANTQTALEINASPDRLDLKDTDVKKAKEHNVAIAIGTDAHSTATLDFMKYGVATARRGWLEKKDLLNTLPAKEMLEKLSKKSHS